MRILPLSATIAASAVLSLSAFGSEFDTCVEQHMRGVASGSAEASIKDACIRAAERPLPDQVLHGLPAPRAAFGLMPSFVGGTGLYLSFNNTSDYTITELTIFVEDKKAKTTTEYDVRTFPFVPPPGTLAMGPPRDRTLLKMIGPGRRDFYIPLPETAFDATKWNALYSWSIVSAKGFR